MRIYFFVLVLLISFGELYSINALSDSERMNLTDQQIYACQNITENGGKIIAKNQDEFKKDCVAPPSDQVIDNAKCPALCSNQTLASLISKRDLESKKHLRFQSHSRCNFAC